MKKDIIRLYAEDGKFLRWVDEEHALRLLRTISGKEEFDTRGRFVGVKMLPLYKPSNNDSPTSITPADVQASVGITKGLPEDPANPNRVKAARAKISAWPYVHDDRATIVTPLGVMCPA
ncbi:MAG: hypothetical protein ACRDQZ_19480 [Mycobacteriales bacterium]